MASILVVDDDRGVRQILSMILQQRGHSVLTASNGVEGLMVYVSYRARIDLVVSDIDMPEMNGIELAERIHARDPDRRILLMTGGLPQGRALPHNVGLILKPFRPDELMQAVDGVLAA